MSRLGVAVRETGPLGALRRTTRVGLSLARTQLRKAELALYYSEAQRRLSDEDRADGERTQSALSGRMTGQTVFVAGTGPSLNELDLTRLSGANVIGVNSLFRHPIVSTWQPQFYCLMDENFFTASDSSVRYFDDMRKALPSTVYLTTTRVRNAVFDNKLLPRARTYFVAVDGDIADDHLRIAGFDGLLPCAPNSVMFASLAAVLMGASRVVLVGADHDWLVKSNEEQRRLDPHFYAGKEAVAPGTSVDEVWNPYRSYLTTIEYCRAIWRGYYVLREIAKSRGVEILNATPGTRLDVFKTISFDEAIRLLPASRQP